MGQCRMHLDDQNDPVEVVSPAFAHHYERVVAHPEVIRGPRFVRWSGSFKSFIPSIRIVSLTLFRRARSLAPMSSGEEVA
jgi:hypothetical protein